MLISLTIMTCGQSIIVLRFVWTLLLTYIWHLKEALKFIVYFRIYPIEWTLINLHQRCKYRCSISAYSEFGSQNTPAHQFLTLLYAAHSITYILNLHFTHITASREPCADASLHSSHHCIISNRTTVQHNSIAQLCYTTASHRCIVFSQFMQHSTFWNAMVMLPLNQ